MSGTDEPAVFEDDLAFGLEWEERASERLEEILLSVRATNVDYAKRPELQRAGIDSILGKERPTFDVKVQSNHHTDTGNLPIEVMSVVEDMEPGWFYTSDADMVVWLYENKAGTNLHHTGYLMPLRDGLIEWFNDRKDEFRRITKPNKGQYGDNYTTVCRLVPIEQFPAEYLAEFDPRLPNDRETSQSDLGEWGGGVSDAE